MKIETKTIKRNNKGIWIIGICLISLLVGSIIGYTIAQSTTTFYIGSGIYPSEADYTVYREGNLYYAKNKYGYPFFPDGNSIASDVINYCLTNGGHTHLSSGIFNLTNSLVISGHNTKLTGEGRYISVLSLGNNVNKDVIKSLTESDLWNVEFKDFSIWGNKAYNTLGSGLNFTWFGGVRIDRIQIDQCAESGFVSRWHGGYVSWCYSSSNNKYGFELFNTYGNMFYSTYSKENGLAGYCINADGSHGSGDGRFFQIESDTEPIGLYITNVNARRYLFYGCAFLTGKWGTPISYGILINGSTSGITINAISDLNDYGIWINGSSLITLDSCRFSDNEYHGIYLSYTDHISIISNNIIDNSMNSENYDGIRLENATHTKILSSTINGYTSGHLNGISLVGSLTSGSEIAFTNTEWNTNGIMIYGGYDNRIFHSYNESSYITDYP